MNTLITRAKLRRTAVSVAIVLVATASIAGFQIGLSEAISTNVVISQVYGGGGNAGATYTNDFIELFNLDTTSVSLAGWSVQYASATGTGNFGLNSAQLTLLPAITLASGQYLLIQEAAGGGGTTALPTPDVTDATPINMSATGGKVALVNSTVSLACNGGSTPCPPSALALIIDLVGYDGANFFETAPAPILSNTTALFRINGGLTDTDNNSEDFFVSAPAPRNTASPLNPPSTSVPEPSTFLLVGAGLAGVGLMRKKLRK